MAIELFISHSRKDVRIAKRLIKLLRAALNLPPEAIRCTSVPGFKLPVGANTDEHLRREIQESSSFIGLITDVSFESAYVLFELGARWGGNMPMAPLLAAGTSAAKLRGPIGGKNALSCDDEADLHQLIDDIGKELSRQAAKPASYNDEIKGLVAASVAMRGKRMAIATKLKGKIESPKTGEILPPGYCEVKGRVQNYSRQPLYVMTGVNDTYWPTDRIFPRADGTWSSTVNFGHQIDTHAIFLAAVDESTATIIEQYKKKAAAERQWTGVQIRPLQTLLHRIRVKTDLRKEVRMAPPKPRRNVR